MPSTINLGDANLTIGGVVTGGEWRPGTGLARSYNVQEALVLYRIPLSDLRVFDAPGSMLPAAAANDDLGLIEGAIGTAPWTVDAGDVGGTTSTRKARFNFALPPEYDDAASVSVRVRGAMVTTVADTAATIDINAYEDDSAGAVGADLCTTALQSINSLTPASLDFVITPTGLVTGDMLDIMISLAYQDADDLGVMTPTIFAIWMMLDVKG